MTAGLQAPGRRQLLAAACAVAALLAGCAPPVRRAGSGSQHWAGRLGVQVEAPAGTDEPARSFSAGFDLAGSAEAGALTLFSPLGQVLARLHWTPAHAQLTNGQETRESASLAELVRELTGTELPIAALFAWLQGEAAQVPGWQAELDRLAEGRLVARRHAPAPQAVLRIVLDR